MEKRENLLRRVAFKCGDFARQLSYHRALGDHSNDFIQNFWICMYNNAIDLAVLDWFHLFGYQKDHLHWKIVIREIDCFRNGLLRAVGMTEEKWRKYRQSIKDYRDKDVAHIEVRAVSQVPEMTVALQAATYYYGYIFKELSGYANYDVWPSDLTDYYNSSLAQTKPLVALAYKAAGHIEEKVR
jgi:hypothetical protein